MDIAVKVEKENELFNVIMTGYDTTPAEGTDVLIISIDDEGIAGEIKGRIISGCIGCGRWGRTLENCLNCEIYAAQAIELKNK